jgi:hypothetical protein
MGLELASFLLALGFYLLFLLSFLCLLGKKNGDKAGPYQVEEERWGSEMPLLLFFQSFLVLAFYP